MLINHNLNKIKSKNKGYLMIEVLVSLVIFSTSLIALLSLQVNSLSSNQSASYRSVATNYANDMLEKMRSNKDSVINGSYTSVSDQNRSCRDVNFNSVNTVTDCTTTFMAQDDIREFKSEVASSLPQGEAVICLDSSQSQGTPTTPNCDGLGSLYVVKIFWKDSRGKLIGTNSGYSQVIVGGII